MKHRPFILAVCWLALAVPLRAGCGSSSCPLDLNALNAPAVHGFALDLSLQYIDQDQLQIGTHSAQAGDIETHHDEVRTINRITTASLTYAFKERLHVTATVPFVSRNHLHLASSHGHITTQHNTVPEKWDIRGLGDVSFVARARIVSRDPVTHSGLWLIGGIKLPTGADDQRNADGEIAELPIQPGSGSTDGIAGLSYQGGFVRPTALQGEAGGFAVVPYFVTATYQFRGATGQERLGNELQVNAGGMFPLVRRVDALLQLNGRIRGRDRTQDPEEAELSGGKAIYASPGLRVSVHGAALYAIAQIPLYQWVNRIQLTSRTNYMVGVQTRF